MPATSDFASFEADDVLVLFSGAPGQTASDNGTGLNSPFAEALAKRPVEPGLPIQFLGSSVRDDMRQGTGGR